jgi:lipoprotein-releasing system permease protein
VGAGNSSIQKIFLFHAAYIISWGMFWGNVVGLTLCFLQQQFGLLKLPEQSYYVTVAPVAIDFLWILLLNAGTLLISLLFLIIPSKLVSRIQPVKAIRFN